jgi:4a-hydroxytetrahydrobiopterin dehydratase
MMTEKLNEQSIQSWLEKRPGWSVKDGALVKDFHFESFRNTIVFVNRVASLADEAGTVPDIDIRNEKVRLALSTPEADGITERDLELAQRIDFATSAR